MNDLGPRLEEARNRLIEYSHSLQHQYVYYILAVAAASVGFAVSLTKNEPFFRHHIPLALAVLAWITSFVHGLAQLEVFQKGTHINIEGFERQIKGDMRGYRECHQLVEKLSVEIIRRRKYQKSFLLLGFAFFLVWHLIQMGENTKRERLKKHQSGPRYGCSTGLLSSFNYGDVAQPL